MIETNQQQVHFDRVARAIDYIEENFRQQPCLDEVAAAVNLSPFHFQRLFSQWAGVSPKKFLQYLSLEYAKELLGHEKLNLMEAADAAGLSGTGRLHDLFVSIECMTPGEFRKGGDGLQINYSAADSPFGKVVVASTSRGVCSVAFEGSEAAALGNLRKRFPRASFARATDKFQRAALLLFQNDWTRLDEIRLHLTATPFQLKVWESLLKIPPGDLVTYGDIARGLGKPTASRAVGAAVGSNPVAFLIPCHRVIQATGKIGGYRWGATRKAAMIGWEAARAGTG